MEFSRRTFLKGALAGGAGFSLLGFDLAPAVAQLKELKIARATETRSTCPYCAVGCGVLIYTIGDRAKNVTPQVIHVEGDPDHPTNRGTLCPKGASLEQDILNQRRLLKPQVRRPGADHWEDISWDNALDEIAHWTKKTRDDTFVEKDAQRPDRESLRRHRLDRRLHGYKRVQLSGREGDARPGARLFRKPGQGLTRPHGLKFGTNIRTRGDDQWLDRHQEHRHDVDHGWQSRRKPSLRLQVGDGGKAQPQRQADFGGSALHAHICNCRSVLPDPRRHRTSRSWAA